MSSSVFFKQTSGQNIFASKKSRHHYSSHMAFYHPTHVKTNNNKPCNENSKPKKQHEVISHETVSTSRDTASTSHDTISVSHDTVSQSHDTLSESKSSYDETWPNIVDESPPEHPVTIDTNETTLAKYIHRFRTSPPTSRNKRAEIIKWDFWWKEGVAGSPWQLVPSKEYFARQKIHQSTPMIDTHSNEGHISAIEKSAQLDKRILTDDISLQESHGDHMTPETQRSDSDEVFNMSDASCRLPLEWTEDQNLIDSTEKESKRGNKEDDILYQWRLRRKIEEARNDALRINKGSPQWLPSKEYEFGREKKTIKCYDLEQQTSLSDSNYQTGKLNFIQTATLQQPHQQSSDTLQYSCYDKGTHKDFPHSKHHHYGNSTSGNTSNLPKTHCIEYCSGNGMLTCDSNIPCVIHHCCHGNTCIGELGHDDMKRGIYHHCSCHKVKSRNNKDCLNSSKTGGTGLGTVECGICEPGRTGLRMTELGIYDPNDVSDSLIVSDLESNSDVSYSCESTFVEPSENKENITDNERFEEESGDDEGSVESTRGGNQRMKGLSDDELYMEVLLSKVVGDHLFTTNRLVKEELQISNVKYSLTSF